MSLEAGNILRETREQMGVSIKDASDSLHIRIPYLQALESGRAEIIPSAVQARGFLRIYAEYLGLSTADIIQEWDNPGSTALSAGKPREDGIASGTAAAPLPGDASSNPMPPTTAPMNFSGFRNREENSYPKPISGAIPAVQQQPTAAYQSPAVAEYRQQPDNLAAQAENISVEDSAAQNNKKSAKKQKKEKKKKEPGENSGHFSLFRKKPQETPVKPDLEESAQELFNDIGRQLNNRRTMLALSLEDCESQTLIRSIYLSSMESGNFEQLPSLIQARGMLNNYASFLDLDVDDLMLKFATALQLLSQKKNRRGEEQKHKPAKRAGRLKKFFTPDLFIGIFVIVGIAGIIIYSAITITAYRRSVAESTPDLGLSLLEQYMDTTRTPEFLPTVSMTPDVLDDIITNPYAAIVTPEDTEEEDETALVTSSQPVQLFVTANQRALMTVISDGKEVFSGRTLPNNTYPFDAENLIELTVSNADAISVVYNQQNLGRPGKLGEVMTIDFSPFMAATPTPQFSPTPTNTYEPTYTPQPETPLPTNTSTPYIP